MIMFFFCCEINILFSNRMTKLTKSRYFGRLTMSAVLLPVGALGPPPPSQAPICRFVTSSVTRDLFTSHIYINNMHIFNTNYDQQPLDFSIIRVPSSFLVVASSLPSSLCSLNVLQDLTSQIWIILLIERLIRADQWSHFQIWPSTGRLKCFKE